MRSNFLEMRRIPAMIFCLAVCMAFSGAFGERSQYHGGGGSHSYHEGHGGGGYSNSYGRWHHDYYSGFGAFYWGLPFGFSSVTIGGLPYYYYDGTYFEPYGAGYIVIADPTPEVVVPAAVITAPARVAAAPATAPRDTVSSTANPAVGGPAAQSENQTTINVPNSNGTFTPVKLTKHGKGYLGPQGEFYIGHPTIAQLKALYGD